MTSHKTFIQLNSGDYSVNQQTQNASNFRNTLAMPMIFDNDRSYEICVYDAFFPVYQDTRSVYINTNLVNASIVGSQLTNTVYFIPYSELSPSLDSNLYYTTSYSRKWYPLAIKNINYIDISFTLSTGEPLPIHQGDYSSVTLAIREIV